ncbi:NAD(P)H-dependent flavin oxidoreductase [Sphingomonas carotinifaciens]|uniref:Nitronate monooxygenase n=1 Tax=Sphingomonas carotinifaciens TaxID=1166323 RepID=A0A1G7KY08_9SPHN|nr:nitronate monooxygenase [Sphingomonas carotinifaciens]MBB4085449.1 nitronate monooxygenase [Sphingomonas carotinifaciens]MWC43528.1 nitronate monooxygenase [Sphingomonas carotinifaciens]SDF41974.1 nitronate monooxygenase [Sphingomonas carotinifaciens]
MPAARLNLSLPLVQAPMAGVSTPAMAAAVCEAGGLGSIALGASDAAGAAAMIADLRARTARPFAVNLFVHAAPHDDGERAAAWIDALAPTFAEFDAVPPTALRAIYPSFAEDDAMLALLLATRPAVVSFHFGLPGADRIAALRAAGCLLLASVTSPAEAAAARAAGIDVLVAQGIEAGGHRGVFDPAARDDALGTLALVRLLARGPVPVIAAGGIMDGAGVDAALALGAVAAQLGTAFIACPESAADDAYRAALMGPGAAHTVMTRAISGRPARCLPNRFTALGERLAAAVPAYPVAYDAGKALNAAAKAVGETGYGAQWAGQGAPLARAMPAGDLVRVIAGEMRGKAA